MKKSLLMLTGIVICATTFASCNSATNSSDTTKAKPQTFIEQQQKAQERKAQQAKAQEAREKREAENKAAWEEFNKMRDKEKSEWIADQKARIDRRDSIHAAKRTEMEKKWAKFNNMTMDEQIELLKERGVVPHIHQHNEAEHNHSGHNHSHDGHQHGKKQPAPQLKDVKINNVPMKDANNGQE